MRVALSGALPAALRLWLASKKMELLRVKIEKKVPLPRSGLPRRPGLADPSAWRAAPGAAACACAGQVALMGIWNAEWSLQEATCGWDDALRFRLRC